MVSTLNYLCSTGAPWSTIQPHQAALLNHLHNTPVTLPDVRALVPHLLCDKQVMNKLATNIGRHSARSTISAPAVEEMLMHIFVSGDWDAAVFTRTKDQIERFRREREEWVRGYLPDRKHHFAQLVARVDALSLDGGEWAQKVGILGKASGSFAQTRVCDGGQVVRGNSKKPKIRVGVPNVRGKGGRKKGRKAGKEKEVLVKSTAWMKEMRVEVQTAPLANVLFKSKRGGKEKVRRIVVKMPEG
ncbi:hypothetical protein BDU57DRAFT_515092 [Ampelomyces quisqualis]|uniref:Uncharacterized protein n=1 Tax=Ampelomyces quisqualis TaxID=50730 RepID=A0A6A5QWY8_AMPQU|nr:hypothetical protein BDU57DRAFT_515092 [Ampelomyces quisqualis]